MRPLTWGSNGLSANSCLVRPQLYIQQDLAKWHCLSTLHGPQADV